MVVVGSTYIGINETGSVLAALKCILDKASDRGHFVGYCVTFARLAGVTYAPPSHWQSSSFRK